RRAERRTAATCPAARCSRALRTAVPRVGVTDHVVMAPDAIGGKQRNVRDIPHAIPGVPNHRLPRALRVPGAGAANDAGLARLACGAAAGTSAAGTGRDEPI